MAIGVATTTVEDRKRCEKYKIRRGWDFNGQGPNRQKSQRSNILTAEVPVEPVEAAEHEEVLERLLLQLAVQIYVNTRECHPHHARSRVVNEQAKQEVCVFVTASKNRDDNAKI